MTSSTDPADRPDPIGPASGGLAASRSGGGSASGPRDAGRRANGSPGAGGPTDGESSTAGAATREAATRQAAAQMAEVEVPMPPAMRSMWRLCRLGFRHEPRLMFVAFVLALAA